jgi:hypothetical protein
MAFDKLSADTAITIAIAIENTAIAFSCPFLKNERIIGPIIASQRPVLCSSFQSQVQGRRPSGSWGVLSRLAPQRHAVIADLSLGEMRADSKAQQDLHRSEWLPIFVDKVTILSYDRAERSALSN